MTADRFPSWTAGLRPSLGRRRVRELLGDPVREEHTPDQKVPLRWYYRDHVVVVFRDGGGAPVVDHWTWRPSVCPSCGEPLGDGATRCWTKGCDVVAPVGWGSFPFVTLRDARTILAHWVERPRTAFHHGDPKVWTLSLDDEPFRYRAGETGEWYDSLGCKPPRNAKVEWTPDGHARVRFTRRVSGYQDWTGSAQVEVRLDPEARVAEIWSSVTLDTDG